MSRVPKHAIYIRWGTFQLNIVGRWPILAWVAAAASLFGIKLFL